MGKVCPVLTNCLFILFPRLTFPTSGRHGAVIAQPVSSVPAIWDNRSEPGAADADHWIATDLGGLEGWQAVKIVSAPPNGRLKNILPHDVRKEVEILRRLDHSNVSSHDHSYSNRIGQLKLRVSK